jgi:hypothetical protein
MDQTSEGLLKLFPINGCHQRVVTIDLVIASENPMDGPSSGLQFGMLR